MKTAFFFLSFMGLLFFSLKLKAELLSHSINTDQRQYPSCYDPGPEKNSEWGKLFGQTPNYRAIGKKILRDSREKFRWKFGPMWYRGRLGENEVKVLVVGQEGAQDENISNRAFTGSTGTKTQNFLNHIGIKRSYLFLNTFVYTINGQLDHSDEAFKWMEQGLDSPIVEYRHKLFNQAVKSNPDSLALLLGVGSGGKASIATWINSYQRKKCELSSDPKSCPTDDFKKAIEEKLNIKLTKDIVAIGVPHPGAVRNSHSASLVINGFSNAAKSIVSLMKENQHWLLPWDSSRNNKFKYTNASIPFCDFAFGTNWRMGYKGTTSNRRTSRAIQIYSEDGRYNNKDHFLSYNSPKDVYGSDFISQTRGYTSMHENDLAYESPRYHGGYYDDYDYGPCAIKLNHCPLSQKLQNWPNFWKLNGAPQPISSLGFGTGAVYRGNLQDARVLILADQGSNDDLFSTRALTGYLGQSIQAYLRSLGAYEVYRTNDEKDLVENRYYAIIRTLPVDTLGMDESDLIQLANHEEVQKARNAIMEEILTLNKTKVLVSFGPVAEAVAKTANNWGIEKAFYLTKYAKNGNWGQFREAISKAAKLKSNTSYNYEDSISIPRNDLPIHTRWWMGTTGTRSVRAKSSDIREGAYYKVYAPFWVSKLKPKALSTEEKLSIEEKMNENGI